MRIVVTLALAAGAALLGSPLPAAHAENRLAALVIDGNTGQVLFDQFADAPRHPASLAKMMTLYLTFEQIEQGNLTPASKIAVSEAAAGVAPSKLDLKAGEEIELGDAIKALITKSANDVAVAIAERISGSEATFVRLMNTRARQIGMRSTIFTNASGLPDPAQITTARDMLTLALRLGDDFPHQYPLFSLRSFDFRGKTYRTHNTLLYGFPGLDGIKTGYTRASGFNLIASVHADGKHVVAALFGGATASGRNAHMRLLLFRALQKASKEKTRQPQALLVARTQPASSAPRSAAAQPKAPVRERRSDEAASAAAPITLPPEQSEREIQLARVRPVSLAPPDAPNAATSEPSQAAESEASVATASALPKLDFQALRMAIAREEAPAHEPPPEQTAPPGSIETLLAAPPDASPLPSAQATEPKDALSAAGPTPSGAAPESDAVASQPSAPQGQAAALATVESGPAPSVDAGPTAPDAPGPVMTDANAPGSDLQPKSAVSETVGAPARGYQIQVGAFATVAEAERQIAAAKGRAANVLSGHPSISLPAQKGARQIFRARFAGFDASNASVACAELRRFAIDCLVMKAD